MKIKSAMCLVMVTMACFTSFGEEKDPAIPTVGRVRFVEGNSAVFAFQGIESHLGLDFLVLLGAAFNTKEGRVELMDLNENTYWFDRETQFHFESYDPNGELTTVFLGKGSFICKTKLPFSMITSSGSMIFPANGTYLIEKKELGKKKVQVTVLDGSDPKVIRKITVFEKLKVQAKPGNTDLVAWQEQREKDWEKTKSRHHVFSNVSIMSPLMANTQADGTLSWQKVEYIRPHFRSSGFIDGNNFYLNTTQLHTSGMMSKMTKTMSDDHIRLWFAVNRYNAIQWAWDVSNGWHAQFYYDPLIGLSAEYQSTAWTSWFCQTLPMGVSFAGWNRWYQGCSYNYGAASARRDWYPRGPYVKHDLWNQERGDARIGGKFFTTEVKPVRDRIRTVSVPVRASQRRYTDQTLVSQRQIRNLDLRLADIRQAGENSARSRSRAAFQSSISNRGTPPAKQSSRVTVSATTSTSATPIRQSSGRTTTRTRASVRGS